MSGSTLAIRDDQEYWTDKQLAALAQLGVDRASGGDLAVFFHHAQRTGLDPFARQIYMIERQGKQTIQTGIDGFRLVARRATDKITGATLGYADVLWCGTDGRWVDVWLAPEPPAAAKATVLRDGQPISAIALYAEYVALTRDGSPNRFWREKPALMIAKCAEALALRKAFPQDLSGLYTSDEMQRSTDGTDTQTTVAPVAAEALITTDQSARIAHLCIEAHLDRTTGLQFARDAIGRQIAHGGELTTSEADTVISALAELIATEKAAAATQSTEPAQQDILDAEIVDPAHTPGDPWAGQETTR